MNISLNTNRLGVDTRRSYCGVRVPRPRPSGSAFLLGLWGAPRPPSDDFSREEPIVSLFRKFALALVSELEESGLGPEEGLELHF